MRVYLAGPISGSTYEEASEWRHYARQRLEDAGFKVADPLRGEVFFRPGELMGDSCEDEAEGKARTVFSRDKFDATRSELLFLNLLDAKRVTIGSMMELAWSHLKGNFSVVLMEKENVHEHAFVRLASSVVLDGLDKGLDYVISTFGER